MSSAAICRVCLAVGVRLLSINGVLQLVFEKITGTALHTPEKKPIVACYVCYARLKKCHKLILSASKAENVLNAILYNHSKITIKSVSVFDRRANGLTWSLTITRPECYQNFDAPALAEIKTEPVASLESENEEPDDFPLLSDLADVPDIKSESDDEPISPSHEPSTDVDLTAKIADVPQPLKVPDNKSGSDGEPVRPSHECSTDVDKIAKIAETLQQDNMVNIPDSDIKSEYDLDSGSPSQCNNVDMTTEKVSEKGTLQLDNMVNIPDSDIKYEFDVVSGSPSHCNKDVDTEEVAGKGFPQPICLPDSDIKTEPEDPLSLPQSTDVGITELAGEAQTPSEKQAKGNITTEKRSVSQSKTKTTERPHRCDICKRKFPTSKQLNTHLKAHNDEKPYKCTVCSTRFKRNDMLIRHSKTHSNEKPFECVSCQKQFKRAEHLKRHLKTHSSEELYECSICRDNIKGIELIMKHVRSHTSGKYYECDDCQRRFKEKGNLVRHFKTHMDEKHKCKVCQRWFKHSNNLSRHLKTQHWRETT